MLLDRIMFTTGHEEKRFDRRKRMVGAKLLFLGLSGLLEKLVFCRLAHF